MRRNTTILSDALFEATEGIDHYLTPEWEYGDSTRSRALVIRAAMDALRLLLDTIPSAANRIEAAIAGDDQAIDQQVALFAKEWRQQETPNLDFSPSDFGKQAHAAAILLRALDQHLVPLLPEVRPLLPSQDA